MDAYVWQASLLCESCAEAIMRDIGRDKDDGTSDHFPQGPYSNGGGEADCPQHCDHCGVFLENPLTPEGYAYAREACKESLGPVTEQWAEFYEL